MKILKNIILLSYSILFNKKIVVLRDLNLKCSFLYRNNIEADFVVKEHCDPNFDFISKPDISQKGFNGQLLKNGLILMVIDLRTVLKNKILNKKEKEMILNSFFNKKPELITCY